MTLLKELGVILAGYALGCFATGYYLVRWRTGQDLRQIASGATGSRNTGRVLGWRGYVVTTLIDILKGSLAMWIALSLDVSAWATALTMIAVVMGHLWPAQLNFHGGKGLTVAYGATLVYDLRFAILVLASAALIAVLTRRVNISVLAAVALSPLISAILRRSIPETAGLIIVAGLILFAHRTNLRALLQPNDKSEKDEAK